MQADTPQPRPDPPPGLLLVVSAPSGAGKTSLVRALTRAVPGLGVSVSHTTRARRAGERDGRDYHFVSRAAFEAMIEAGDLLEHALVFDHHYGTSKRWVAETLARGQDVILEIDWQGARQVRAAFPECVSVEVFPPSLAALEERLRARAQDSDEVIARRMDDAVEEMSHFGEFDYLVVNEEFDSALDELRAIVLAERTRTPRRARAAAALVDQLLHRSPRPPARGEAGPGKPAPRRAGSAR